MRGPIWLLSVITILVSLPVFAHAEVIGQGEDQIKEGQLGKAVKENRFQKGTWEIAIGSDSGDLSLEPTIGYFVTDYIEAILHLDFNHLEDELSPGSGSADIDTFSISRGPTFNLPTGLPTLAWLMGIEGVYFSQKLDVAGSTIQDEEQQGFGITFNTGPRFLIGERASLNGVLGFSFLQIDDNDANITVDRTGINLGISFSIFL